MNYSEQITDQDKRDDKFIQYLYDTAKRENWTFRNVIDEIAFAGFDCETVGRLVMAITRNDTFNIK